MQFIFSFNLLIIAYYVYICGANNGANFYIMENNPDVTTSIILDHRRQKKDGTYPVKLRIWHNGKKKLYAIKGHSYTPDEFEIILNPKSKGKAKEARKMFDMIENRALDIINNKLINFTFEEFETQYVSKKVKKETLQNFFKDKISELEDNNKYKSAELYKTTLGTLSRFDPTVSFDKITPDFLKKFESWMIEGGKSITTVGIYLRNLRAVFNQALSDKVINNYPFAKTINEKDKYRIPSAKNIKKALSIEEIQSIFNYKPLNEGEKQAKGYWLFSYLCNGMNMADIANIKYKNIDGNKMTFIRQKTKDTTKNTTFINVFLLPEAFDIIKDLGNTNKSPDGYLFPIYNETMTQKQKFYKLHRQTKIINKHMNQIATNCNINKKVNTYHARHSFSTISKRSGASIEFISEQLGHQNTTVTRNYLDSFEDETREKYSKALINFNKK